MALCLSSGQSFSGISAEHAVVRSHPPDIRQAIWVQASGQGLSLLLLSACMHMPPSDSTCRLSRTQVIALYANLSFLQTVHGQLEQQVLDHVKKSAPQGDSQAVLAAIDSFVSDKGMLINIGENKGRLVESVINQHQPMVGISLSMICLFACACMHHVLPAVTNWQGLKVHTLTTLSPTFWLPAGHQMHCVLLDIGTTSLLYACHDMQNALGNSTHSVQVQLCSAMR